MAPRRRENRFEVERRMTDDYLSPESCRLLDTLYTRTHPTADIPGPVLAALVAHGLAEVTWAGRARLTDTGRSMFDVCGTGSA